MFIRCYVGWQPRWFILDYGVLAYYRSQDEVHLGSRGSVKLSCCEICGKDIDCIRTIFQHFWHFEFLDGHLVDLP